ncbi:c-type cytochrome [Pseudomonas sp. A3.4]|nr:di-heme oxidoredictase family protein [Atopomonas sediminilitoris]MCJ8168713.1 c-type cytochrome [Atopomonas sediminilitoris]
MPAGSASVTASGRQAFSLPSANLAPSRRVDFAVGNSFFRNPWVSAPASTTARDGLGPLFNTNACQNCHIRDGRGHAPDQGSTQAVSLLVRLSIPANAGDDARLLQQGNVPEPTYGKQLQDMANPGSAREALVSLTWHEQQVHLNGGQSVTLRRPALQLSELNYGPLHPHTQFSLRVAPPMIGLGLLEAIPEAAILTNADPEDHNQDGIRGVANQVWDVAQQRTRLGRFGWKAGQPSLNQQNAAAFAGDLGLTSHLFEQDDCTAAQPDCQRAPHGGDPEVSDNILRQVLFYTRHLAVPKRPLANTEPVLMGKALFQQVGCTACHTPSFTTAENAAEPELSNQTIWPYSDLLLHDMGPELADNRGEFIASGRQWRTPPLWGLGHTAAVSGQVSLLHDGRARSVLEAILWHGGEAQPARDAVIALPHEQRQHLVHFVNSL